MDLKNALASKFAMDLPATLVFDFPTIQALSAMIFGQSSLSDTAEPANDSNPGSNVSQRRGTEKRGKGRGVSRHARAEQTWPRVAVNRAERGDILTEIVSIVQGVLGTAVSPEQPLMEVTFLGVICRVHTEVYRGLQRYLSCTEVFYRGSL